MNCIEKVEKLLTDLKTSSDQQPIRIVVLQRGWVVIGRFSQIGCECFIKNGYVIRRWGTTNGLGELALEGKQSNTVLDKIPVTHFHELTIVMML
ncbi:MAG: hypothetical protein SFU99_12880, partial [Saprospiraceae bacterium]|nr:hypothetical protein [Saprospiraceae bacterium]